MDLENLIKQDNSNLIKRLENIQFAMQSIKDEMGVEYEIEQNNVYFTYSRPHQMVQKKNKAHNQIDAILKGLLGGDNEALSEALKGKLESKEVKVTVPKTSAMRFTSTQALRVLTFILKIYEEEEQEIKQLIKDSL